MTHHEHAHDHGIEGESHGIALGFRIFEHEGEIYFAEAEIAAYVDDPGSLGATLVFHRLSGIDPTDPSDELDWPAWHLDIDDELERQEGDPVTEQFRSILLQLSRLREDELREFLLQAMEAAESEA